MSLIGWKIYKKIGADWKMKQMYLHYQIFFMLLKMLLFFFLAFLVRFLVLLDLSDPEFVRVNTTKHHLLSPLLTYLLTHTCHIVVDLNCFGPLGNCLCIFC
jgi:hypothetical protein